MIDPSNSEYAKVVLFVVFGIIIGNVLEFILAHLKLPIPYTVMVFFVGIILSLIREAMHIQAGSFIEENAISADLIVFLFLPALLFSETMNLNLHHVQKAFSQSVLLAGPGGVMVAFQLAVCAYLFLPFGWSWLYCFLFGAILSATDPVSVVVLLKSAKASSKLTTVIAGESLLNDGSAMILYFFFANLIKGYTYTVGTFIEFCLKMLFVSPLIGLAFGAVSKYIMTYIMRPTDMHIDIQIIITFICGYASFYVAQGPCAVSGVLSCCTAGVTLALFVSPKILLHEKMHEIWSIVEWCCNTLIFLLGGLVGGAHSSGTVTVINVCYLVMMYAFLVVTRMIMVALLYPMLSKWGLKCSWDEAKFVAFSGLRGALAIALALTAASEQKADSDDNKGNNSTGNQIFFMVTGLVAMTLLFNGSTAGWVLLRLKLVDDPDAPPSAQLAQVLGRIKSFLARVVSEELEAMKDELGDFDVAEVGKLCRLMNNEYDIIIPAGTTGERAFSLGADEFIKPLEAMMAHHGHGLTNDDMDHDDSDYDTTGVEGGGKGGNGADYKVDEYHQTNLGRMSRASGTMDVDNDLVAYVRHTFLEVVRARYLEDIETGKIGNSNSSAKLLLYSVDVAQDFVRTRLADFESIEHFLKPNTCILRVSQFIDDTCHSLFNKFPGLVGILDAKTERIAVYVLINFIDAHEYALSQMHYFLGGPKENSGEFDIAGPEEATVRRESEMLLEKAHYLLRTIAKEDVRKVYTHRAAKVIVIKQTEMLERMVKEGSLSDKNARHLFKTIEGDRDRIEIERASHDRSFVKETKNRKMAEEREMRESFRKTQAAISMTATTNPNTFVQDGTTVTEVDGVGASSELPINTSSDGAANPLHTVGSYGAAGTSPIAHGMSPNRPSLRQNLTGEDNVSRGSFQFKSAPNASPAVSSTYNGGAAGDADNTTTRGSIAGGLSRMLRGSISNPASPEISPANRKRNDSPVTGGGDEQV